MGIIWAKSGSIEFDNNGLQADGAIANFFVGGTTTPLVVYQDASETTPLAADLSADANGRWPVVFIPFTTSYDVKVRTEGGTQLYYYREIPNPNPVEAAADTVPDEAQIRTGMVHWEPVNETKVGFVRLNGRTIGNAASGATERANADTADLFAYLWNKLSNSQTAVSGGRGASAAADYAANKTITLLDGRSGVLRGLDDMGNSGSSRLGGAPFTNGNATTAGSALGANTHTLIPNELPVHSHTFSATTSSDGAHTHTFSGTSSAAGAHNHAITDPGHVHGISSGNTYVLGTGGGVFSGGGLGGTTSNNNSAVTGISLAAATDHTHTYSGTTSSNGAHTHTVSGTTGGAGSDVAHNNVSYGLLGTFFQRL